MPVPTGASRRVRRAAGILLAAAVALGATSAPAVSASYVDPATVNADDPFCLENKQVIEDMKKARENSAAAGALPDLGTDEGKKVFRKFVDGLGDTKAEQPDWVGYFTSGSLLMPLVFGILFAVVNECCCCYGFCCRGCCLTLCPGSCRGCNKCRHVPLAIRPYTKLEKLLPFGVIIAVGLFIISFAFVGMVNGVGGLGASIIDGGCFFDSFHDRIGVFVDNVAGPLSSNPKSVYKTLESKDTGFPALEDIVDRSEKCSFPSSCRTGVPTSSIVISNTNTAKYNLAQAVSDLGAYSGHLETAAGSLSNMGTICSNLKPLIEDASRNAKKAADEFDQALRDISTEIKASLVDQKDSILKTIKDADKSVVDLKKQLQKPIKSLSELSIDAAKLFKTQQSNVGFSIYGYSFLSLAFVGIGFVLILLPFGKLKTSVKRGDIKYNPDLEGDVLRLKPAGKCGSRFTAFCGWWLFFFFGIFAAFAGGLFTYIATVGNDFCSVLPTLPQAVVSGAGPQVKDIIDGCWEDKSLADVLNLTSAIVNSIDGVDTASFAKTFDSGAGVSNDALVKVYTDLGTNCGTDVPQALANLIDQIYIVNARIAGKELKTSSGSWCWKVLTDPYTKAGQNCDTAADSNSVISALLDTIQAMLDEIKRIVQVDLTTALKCGWIKKSWDEIVSIMCSGVFGSVGIIGMSALALGILALPWGCSICFASKRHGGHGPVKIGLPSGGMASNKVLPVAPQQP